MNFSRRGFVQAGAQLATGAMTMAVVPRPLLATIGTKPEVCPDPTDSRLKELVAKALDAARVQGANYSDVRFVHDREFESSGSRIDAESMAVAVRSLVDGYWGYATSSVWSGDEAARLGKESVRQAKSNGLSRERPMSLAPAPAVADGNWVTPVEIDPFSISNEEMNDHIVGLGMYLQAPFVRGIEVQLRGGLKCFRRDSVFGSSENSYCTQRIYRSSADMSLTVRDLVNRTSETRFLNMLTPSGIGWELFQNENLRPRLSRMVDDMLFSMNLPLMPTEPGRYNVVFDATSMAELMSKTIGMATESDRVFGYEANAGGTSYISDYDDMLGSLKIGNSLLTVHANRDERGGAATVKYDDEGVEPDKFTLVRDGILTDLATGRESATWVSALTNDNSRARSHGCCQSGGDLSRGFGGSAMNVPAVYAPNLKMQVDEKSVDFESLIRDLDKGIALTNAKWDMDQQQLNGLGIGRAYEVSKGKRVSRLITTGALIRAPEFWKTIIDLGGASSAERIGLKLTKGEPTQTGYHSVTAVPALVKETTIINVGRRA